MPSFRVICSILVIQWACYSVLWCMSTETLKKRHRVLLTVCDSTPLCTITINSLCTSHLILGDIDFGAFYHSLKHQTHNSIPFWASESSSLNEHAWAFSSIFMSETRALVNHHDNALLLSISPLHTECMLRLLLIPAPLSHPAFALFLKNTVCPTCTGKPNENPDLFFSYYETIVTRSVMKHSCSWGDSNRFTIQLSQLNLIRLSEHTKQIFYILICELI